MSRSSAALIASGLVAIAASGPAQAADDACAIARLGRSDASGLVVPSPDGLRDLVNRKDANGVAQLYVGDAPGATPQCISCTERPGGPRVERFKMQPHWHPSGRWIFTAVERDHFTPPPLLGLSRAYVEGQLQSGLWTNLYAVSPDGEHWFRLTDFESGKSGKADGYSGPAVTPDGRRVVYSQVVDGNVFAYYPFGRWQLIEADFSDDGGVPRLSNQRDITPVGMNWNEPGNFHPDGQTLLLSGSTLKDAQGMDQYTLDLRTGALRNLTNSPTVWDEHGRFSPDGSKILFMSAAPYRDDPGASKVLSIKTEFMLMNADGSEETQLTHFRTPGYPESSKGIAANPEWNRDGDGASLRQLVFPDYQDWTIAFDGACGGKSTRRPSTDVGR